MRALPLQVVLEDLQKARNKLNIVILDACRDNPYSWGRSGSRGLTVVSYQPPGSIIVYATSAGSTALEGTGRNGVFTGELLKHLKTPGIDVMEVFTRAGASVQLVTNGRQNPAIYTQFFDKAYFVSAAAQKSYGSIAATVQTGGTLVLDGRVWGNVASGSTVILNEVDAGQHELRMEYSSGHVEQKSVEVLKDRQAKISFDKKLLQVRYDSNGATSGKAPVDEASYEPGELIIARANTGSLEKTGYSFAGWNTKPDGTGISYQPGDIIAMRGADATLFAQWKETASFRPQTGWIDFSNVPPNTDIYLDGEYFKSISKYYRPSDVEQVQAGNHKVELAYRYSLSLETSFYEIFEVTAGSIIKPRESLSKLADYLEEKKREAEEYRSKEKARSTKVFLSLASLGAAGICYLTGQSAYAKYQSATNPTQIAMYRSQAEILSGATVASLAVGAFFTIQIPMGKKPPLPDTNGMSLDQYIKDLDLTIKSIRAGL